MKVFLTALAIIDDLGAVAIIAVFYTGELSLLNLGLAAAVIVVLVAMNRFGVGRLLPYLLLGGVLWFCVLRSGVHATIAGVALAFTIPLDALPGKLDDMQGSPLHRLEHGLHYWVAFLIIPIFGFANAGDSFAGVTADALVDRLTLGVALGLLIKKTGRRVRVCCLGNSSRVGRSADGCREAAAARGVAPMWDRVHDESLHRLARLR